MHELTVLILARDILGAGLLGALVETASRTPLYPLAGERADAALLRLRPAVVLLEAYHAAARSDVFFETATAVDARVILFAPAAPWEDVAEIARRRRVTAFVHPEPGGSLATLLGRILRDLDGRRG